MYLIEKVLNHNSILVSKKKKNYLVLEKGIGFQKKANQVIQLDEDMKYLGKTDLVNGKNVTLNENTKYLAITISNPYVKYEVNYNTYQEFFEDGMIITFKRQ